MNGDQGMMRAMAKQAVQRFAGMEPGRPVGGTYYLYRTLRNLDLDNMLDKMMEATQERDAVGELTPLEERLEREEYETASRSSRARSRPRSAGGWSPTAAPRRWPRPCASRCPRTSSSCTPHATRWSSLQEGAVPAHPQAGRAAGAQAQARPQGPARLPQHGPALVELRRRARRAEVQVPAAGQARADRHRRHLRLGRGVRPLHADARVRDPEPVLEGALVRVHRRHRRGDRLLPGATEDIPRRSTGSTPRPTSSGSTATPTTAMPSRCSGSVIRQGRRPEVDRAAARRRPEQLPRVSRAGSSRRCSTRPATCTG